MIGFFPVTGRQNGLLPAKRPTMLVKERCNFFSCQLTINFFTVVPFFVCTFIKYRPEGRGFVTFTDCAFLTARLFTVCPTTLYILISKLSAGAKPLNLSVKLPLVEG